MIKKAFNAKGNRIGQDHGRAKYTNREADQVRQMALAGLTTYGISKRMEIPRRTVRDILSGRIRSSAPDHYR